MQIRIEGASENNLRDVDVEFGDGLTVVTGVSGSGKSSLVFDTLYHEARRRFLDIFAAGSSGPRLAPADVRNLTGLTPAVAVEQDVLNRNPGSTLATATGLHPLLRLLFARFGERGCPSCGAAVAVLTEDAIVARLRASTRSGVTVEASVARGVVGSHRTLLRALVASFGRAAIRVDGHRRWPRALDPGSPHDIDVAIGQLRGRTSATEARHVVETAAALGATTLILREGKHPQPARLARAPVCTDCGTWLEDVAPVHFHRPCPSCEGEGCDQCFDTGLTPAAAAVRWEGDRIVDYLARSVDDAAGTLAAAQLPPTADRLADEIRRRLEALRAVGLEYLTLDRPSPTLSRGESQRVRLAVSLTSRLEDLLHILDEPTIGLHPSDVSRVLPAFRQLGGPVIYVEHDRLAAAQADHAIDIGPGAGGEGGEVVFSGTPSDLWSNPGATGRFFSQREEVATPEHRPAADSFIRIRGAHLRNLRDIDVRIPLERLTVITGVSGSGKTTLMRDVLVASLDGATPSGCCDLDQPGIKTLFVDQSPIGRNPRSNPATYTKLADAIRDGFAAATDLSPSHFSFNRKEGCCPACDGMGAVEVRMRYMPSTWIACADCGGRRFSDEVLAATVPFDGRELSIADVYALTISDLLPLIRDQIDVPDSTRRTAIRILAAMADIGLGYLTLGQPSPTLSGGEAQRVKLARVLGRRSLSDMLLVLDEPSTGLHPADIAGLLKVLDRLARAGATIVIVEHNLDVIRAADWVVDLGPGSGPDGGELIYEGPLDGIEKETSSATGRALRQERRAARPRKAPKRRPRGSPDAIEIRGARANNLRGIDVDIPKAKMTVVTGVSGSGKSSLVRDVLEAESRRRFLESLSSYERQATREGPEAEVDRVRGLGVTLSIDAKRRRFARRATVGSVTEIIHHLATLLSRVGTRDCPECGDALRRERTWRCPACDFRERIGEPRHFSSSTYSAACTTCHGVGSLRQPNPDKLIIHPECPLCDGAMHSPGFFPKGYVCKPYNGGHDQLQALAQRYRFDPATTPWNEMSDEARQAFLFGDPEPMDIRYESRTGRTHVRKGRFPGFYGWIGDWDTGGTYTDTRLCPDCGGARLRPRFLEVLLGGRSIHQLSTLTLLRLRDHVERLEPDASWEDSALASHLTMHRRLGFLCDVGLGYLDLDRQASTLSAGEAQRISLAGLLGSGLTSLTVLADEPTRGLHPVEVEALLRALHHLRDEGNTVVVVEHDPVVVEGADHVIDIGPGAGRLGGRVVAAGTPLELAATDTPTGLWLSGRESFLPQATQRPARDWMTIRGPRENNLAGEDVAIPLGVLTGVCGVSGSGKSTLVVDILARALAPRKQTTSVASEPVDPGEHDGIDGAPSRVILVDQTLRGVHSPVDFLGLVRPFETVYADSEDAHALGLDAKAFSRRCSECKGSGSLRTDLGFLPDVHTPCESCAGTGHLAEAWEVRVNGLALPELYELTFDDIAERFADEPRVSSIVDRVRQVGLGYLVLRQPGHTMSGGEAQRLKIARELARKTDESALYILDEPTVGLHLADVHTLVAVLQQLVDRGHSVLVVEHHPHLLASCDWLIELGPGGGPGGGSVVASAAPAQLAELETATSPFLREVLS